MGHDDGQDCVAEKLEPLIILDRLLALCLCRAFMGIGRMPKRLFEEYTPIEMISKCRFESVEAFVALHRFGHRMPSTIQPPPITSSSLSAS
jgi:hypothetical protein